MNAEWPTARLQMEDQPRPPGYRNRSPTEGNSSFLTFKNCIANRDMPRLPSQIPRVRAEVRLRRMRLRISTRPQLPRFASGSRELR